MCSSEIKSFCVFDNYAHGTPSKELVNLSFSWVDFGQITKQLQIDIVKMDEPSCYKHPSELSNGNFISNR